jgi:exodeoxyribonuclease VII large subunit
LVIRSRQDVEQAADGLHDRLVRGVRYRLLMARQHLVEVAQHGAFARMMDVINGRQQKLDELRYGIERVQTAVLEKHRRRWEVAAAAVRHYDVRRVVAGIRQELQIREANLAAVIRNAMLHGRARLDTLYGQLEALSPVAILDRGYALVFDASGQLLKDATQLKAGDDIRARLSRGEVEATVKKCL